MSCLSLSELLLRQGERLGSQTTTLHLASELLLLLREWHMQYLTVSVLRLPCNMHPATHPSYHNFVGGLRIFVNVPGVRNSVKS